MEANQVRPGVGGGVGGVVSNIGGARDGGGGCGVSNVGGVGGGGGGAPLSGV